MYQQTGQRWSCASFRPLNNTGCFDVGIRGTSMMVWTVLIRSTTQFPGEQLGGNNEAIVLQPLSVKGEVGFNVALGIASLSLTPLP
jgi:hypothetical protein